MTTWLEQIGREFHRRPRHRQFDSCYSLRHLVGRFWFSMGGILVRLECRLRH